MVVLAASITTSSGKPLLSRQFKDLTKDRVLELLSNFQNLVSNISSDHTFVEDEHVRYVYKPFDDYYIILITNRQSNIIQDLATLNLFSQTINSYVSNFDELEVFDNSFEILSSFDEIICMGYKENLSFKQVNTYLTMESHEERIQDIIERNKEIEATEERKRRAKEIARREQDRKNGIISGDDYSASRGNKFSSSNDPNVKNAYNSYYSHASPAAQQSYAQQKQHEQPIEQRQENSYSSESRSGMKLVGSNTLGNFQPSNTNFTSHSNNNNRSIDKSSYFEDSDESKPTNNGILISVNETINAQFNRDGDIESSELKGVLELRINDPSYAHSSIRLIDSLDVKDRSFQFKTHPNIDKNLFLKEKSISLKDKTKSFPHNDQSLGVVRWRKTGASDDNSLIPFQLSTWVSNTESNIYDVTIEFELTEKFDGITTIENMGFIIPVPTTTAKLNDSANEFNATIVSVNDEVGIVIKLDSPIELNQQGSINFTIEVDDEEALFPISTSFKIKDHNIGGVSIKDIVKLDDENESLPYDIVTVLKSDEYVIA